MLPPPITPSLPPSFTQFPIAVIANVDGHDIIASIIKR